MNIKKKELKLKADKTYKIYKHCTNNRYKVVFISTSDFLNVQLSININSAQHLETLFFISFRQVSVWLEVKKIKPALREGTTKKKEGSFFSLQYRPKHYQVYPERSAHIYTQFCD